jgi:16S rRNA processing protein RimM
LTDPADHGPLTVTSNRRSGAIRLLGFSGVSDRDAAESLRGTTLLTAATDLPDLVDEDEFYDYQLIGLRAVDSAGADLGVVTDVLHAPAAPVLEVRRPDGSTEMVPFVSAIVPVVDVAAGRLVIDPPDGMFG